MSPLVVVLLGGVVFGGVIMLAGFFTVEQQTHAIIERFGKYQRTSGPGLCWRIPIIAVQYLISEDEETVKAAYYRLSNPEQQLSSYVFDTVRALVPEMPVDEVFSEKDKIASAVKERLQGTMRGYGYTIVQSLVNDIQPAREVKEAMNQVNASARLKEAARNEAESRKIHVIAAAEAEARAKELQGMGIAKQRLAIANGLKESVQACSDAGISPEEATKMVLLTQHYDTVTAVGTQSKATILMVPYSPNGMSQIGDQITSALLTTHESNAPNGQSPELPARPQAPIRA